MRSPRRLSLAACSRFVLLTIKSPKTKQYRDTRVAPPLHPCARDRSEDDRRVSGLLHEVQFAPHPGNVEGRPIFHPSAGFQAFQLLEESNDLRHGLELGRMARGSPTQRRDRLVQPPMIVFALVLGEALGLEFTRDLGFLACRLRLLSMLCECSFKRSVLGEFGCSRTSLARRSKS